jgi:ketopantoate reductase
LGGIIGARLLAVGASVSLATRNATSAEEIKASGLRVTGIGGDLSIETGEVALLADYSVSGSFDLIVLATKAQDAIDVAPSLVRLLAPGGTLLPVQNGGVAQILARQLGDECVLGGVSNLTATMLRPGTYERSNAGYLLIGELGGGESDRSERVRQWLSRNHHGFLPWKILVAPSRFQPLHWSLSEKRLTANTISVTWTSKSKASEKLLASEKGCARTKPALPLNTGIEAGNANAAIGELS